MNLEHYTRLKNAGQRYVDTINTLEAEYMDAAGRLNPEVHAASYIQNQTALLNGQMYERREEAWKTFKTAVQSEFDSMEKAFQAYRVDPAGAEILPALSAMLQAKQAAKPVTAEYPDIPGFTYTKPAQQLFTPEEIARDYSGVTNYTALKLLEKLTNNAIKAPDVSAFNKQNRGILDRVNIMRFYCGPGQEPEHYYDGSPRFAMVDLNAMLTSQEANNPANGGGMYAQVLTLNRGNTIQAMYGRTAANGYATDIDGHMEAWTIIPG